jgi:hypothetical protein
VRVRHTPQYTGRLRIAWGVRRLAERLRPTVAADPHPFDEADQAVADLAAERFTGATVISV